MKSITRKQIKQAVRRLLRQLKETDWEDGYEDMYYQDIEGTGCTLEVYVKGEVSEEGEFTDIIEIKVQECNVIGGKALEQYSHDGHYYAGIAYEYLAPYEDKGIEIQHDYPF